ncbi:DEAD/DEAH box helicase [Marinobacterium arenosum]|uniref:DEAD/DEAH box helicase n=1 Tax=Marinobacterium arenosum TaxID=2862496 RepID=UPI001C9473B7|nr:DEAD/DEAH box helicase [Marinobacterium arenosum]MBY4677318.1 DEAD/DEAH box helicase [Marinobacterium arenosum]
MSFVDLELDLELLQGLAEQSLVVPTDIQRQAIPLIMDAQDLLASAPTGTGKTLAFVLPALQHILDQQEPASTPRVLILSPTRELARQTYRVIGQVSAFTEIRSGLIVGGEPYGMQQQLLSEPLDILVATPGRLLEMDDKGWLDLSIVQQLIIDEADRMLDMGFIEPIRKLAELTPRDRQTLMFSATLEGDKVQNLADDLLDDDAQTLSIENPRGVSRNIQQAIYRVDNEEHKQRVLKALLQSPEIKKVLLFVASRSQVDPWVNFVRSCKVMCDGLHGEMPQGLRNERIKKLRKGRVQMLVATDIAARGLDLADISHVINLQLPKKADIYVHRAGRAGRDQSQGYAWSLVDGMDWPTVGRIERYMGSALPRATVAGLEPQKPEPPSDEERRRAAGKAKKARKKVAANSKAKKAKDKPKKRVGRGPKSPKAKD